MSHSFWAATRTPDGTRQILTIPEVNVISGPYKLIIETLKLERFGDSDDIWDGGRCTPGQLREALCLYPDGHPDPYLTMRFGELAQLSHAADKAGGKVIIAWG